LLVWLPSFFQSFTPNSRLVDLIASSPLFLDELCSCCICLLFSLFVDRRNNNRSDSDFLLLFFSYFLLRTCLFFSVLNFGIPTFGIPDSGMSKNYFKFRNF